MCPERPAASCLKRAGLGAATRWGSQSLSLVCPCARGTSDSPMLFSSLMFGDAIANSSPPPPDVGKPFRFQTGPLSERGSCGHLVVQRHAVILQDMATCSKTISTICTRHAIEVSVRSQHNPDDVFGRVYITVCWRVEVVCPHPPPSSLHLNTLFVSHGSSHLGTSNPRAAKEKKSGPSLQAYKCCMCPKKIHIQAAT